jgi:class 3 adenylate cyclase
VASSRDVLALPVVETEPTARSGDRWRRRLAVALAIVAVLEALGLLALGSRGDPRFLLELNFVTIGFFGTIVLFAVVGAFIVVRRPRTRVAWVMIGIATSFGAGLLAGAYGSLYVTPSGGNAGPFAFELLLVAGLWFVPALAVGTTTLLLLYPTDALLTARWRLVAAAAILGSVIWDLGVLFRPGIIDTSPLTNVRNPLGAPAELIPLFDLVAPISSVLVLAAIFLSAVSLFVRYRRGDSIVRAQIRWIGLVAVAIFISFVLSAVLANNFFFFGTGITAIACLPIAIGVAISRYHLYDIDLIINRTVLYGGVTLALLAAFGAANIGLQRLLESTTGQRSELLTGALGIGVGLLYVPIRSRVRPVVDRFLPGRAQLTLLFTDIVGSTERIVELGDERWRMLLGRYRAAVRQELSRHGGHEVDTAGDAFFATFERPSSGVGCAVTMRSAVEMLGIRLRTGVHLGECEMRGEKVSGIEVHTAARIMAAAADGEILLSAAVRDAIGENQFATTYRGSHELKGVPGAWQLYALESVRQAPAPAASPLAAESP